MDFKPEDFEIESKLLLDEELERQEQFQKELVYIPWELLLDDKISSSAKVLYFLLKKFARLDSNGRRAFPTRKRLASMMKISLQQLDTLKKQLREVGYLTWIQEPGKIEEKPWHNVYILRNADSMEQENLLHTKKLAPTNRSGGGTHPPTPMATGGIRSTKKKITRQKFIELADQEIPSWREHYKISYEEGQWYYYGLSKAFSNWLDEKVKDYQENFDKFYPWERKLELLRGFLLLKQ